jgi:putative copper export protein
MAGDPGAITEPAVLAQAATGTLFGKLFLVRLAALLALALLARRDWPALILSAIALALPAATSHAAAASPAHFTAIGVTIDVVHLLAGGFWIGGLALLAGLPIQDIGKPRMLAALSLFSEWAMIAVLLLVMTGLINAAIVVLGGAGKAMPLYLGVLVGKLVLVTAMLALALTNRLELMPRFEDGAIARNIWIELALGIVVIALAGLLGQLPPTAG